MCLKVAEMSADLDDMQRRILDNQIRLDYIAERDFQGAPAGNLGGMVPDYFPDDWA